METQSGADGYTMCPIRAIFKRNRRYAEFARPGGI
jgi:hypothetical protein